MQSKRQCKGKTQKLDRAKIIEDGYIDRYSIFRISGNKTCIIEGLNFSYEFAGGFSGVEQRWLVSLINNFLSEVDSSDRNK